MNIIVSILIGALSGYIASIIMKSDKGIVTNTILGILGGFIGDLIFELLHISFAGYLGTIIISILGACLLIYIVNKVRK